MEKSPSRFQKITHSFWFALLLGLVSNGLLFGAYMYFLIPVVIISAIFGLQRFFTEGVASIPKIRWKFGFLLGAISGWGAVLLLASNHIITLRQ
jgi:hypothetical protein